MKAIRPNGTQYEIDRFVTFDDVMMVPRRSPTVSRFDNDISTRLGEVAGRQMSFRMPIISANMDTVSGEEMVRAMAEHGGLGILHRFMSIEKQVAILERLSASTTGPIAFSVGVAEQDRERVDLSVKACTSLSRVFICVDVAHGHLETVLEMTAYLKNKYPDLKIIAGNVATPAGAIDLADRGADAIKVGIGPGSMCSTRAVAGVGVPQLSAIAWTVDAVGDRASIIADGGIRTSGDAVKALAVGARAVMLGRVLASAEEAAGTTIMTPTGRHRSFRGMASRSAQAEWKGDLPIGLAPEGEETIVPITTNVHDILQQFCGGIRSGMSYMAARNLEDLKRNAVFVEVSAGTRTENKAK